jgi:hypothetical protein
LFCMLDDLAPCVTDGFVFLAQLPHDVGEVYDCLVLVGFQL